MASSRLMDVGERLPTKYPTLYAALVGSFLTVASVAVSPRRTPLIRLACPGAPGRGCFHARGTPLRRVRGPRGWHAGCPGVHASAVAAGVPGSAERRAAAP